MIIKPPKYENTTNKLKSEKVSAQNTNYIKTYG